MIVYDIFVNGRIRETITPRKQRLKEINTYMLEQMKVMRAKYGEQVIVKGRMVY
ncbi:hypothetical protein D3C71_2054610 [compost metagenome]